MTKPLIGGKTYNRDRLLELISAHGPVIKIILQLPNKYKPKTLIDEVVEFEYPRSSEEFLKRFFFHGKTNFIHFKNGGLMTIKRDRKSGYIWTYKQAA